MTRNTFLKSDNHSISKERIGPLIKKEKNIAECNEPVENKWKTA